MCGVHNVLPEVVLLWFYAPTSEAAVPSQTRPDARWEASDAEEENAQHQIVDAEKAVAVLKAVQGKTWTAWNDRQHGDARQCAESNLGTHL